MTHPPHPPHRSVAVGAAEAVRLEQFGSSTLADDGCLTCGDAAVPVQVLEVQGAEALVQDRLGQQSQIAIDFFPDAKASQVLLVHMGVAIARPQEVAS